MTQATALDQLGSVLRSLGLTLAYHVHDAEFRHAAREFHHMLLATDPSNVSFCLDPDWTYRGAGFSQVALFDIVTVYGRRITEVHLRQSRGGIWSETFQTGDIDYGRLVARLSGMGIRPHWVLEQAISADSPREHEVVEAHALSVSATQGLLATYAA
jgi:inosose dehydratase